MSPITAMDIDVNSSLPVHERVLRPLIQQSAECRVYGLKKKAEIYSAITAIISKETRAFLCLDITKEILHGYEKLWNVRFRGRGTILLVLKPPMALSQEVFVHCSAPDVMSSMTQLCKAHTASAIRDAIQLQNSGSLCICFPANNGIEWIDIFAPMSELLRLFDIAQEVGGEPRDFGMSY